MAEQAIASRGANWEVVERAQEVMASRAATSTVHPPSDRAPAATPQAAQTTQAEANGDRFPTWSDPGTGLTWAKEDNGADIDWYSANVYCQSLSLHGHSGWRLPTIDELQGIYDPQKGRVGGYHIKGDIRSYNAWSNTIPQLPNTGSENGRPWYALIFSFINGMQGSSGTGNGSRALCVRSSSN